MGELDDHCDHGCAWPIRGDGPAAQRDESGKVISRDVYAVFAPLQLTLLESVGTAGIVVRAEKEALLEFEWIDRREPRSDRISYYGEFKVTGYVPVENGKPVYWTGATQKAERDGKDILFVKVPLRLTDASLLLTVDRIVTASYEDENGLQPSGRITIADFSTKKRRVIYGDPPRKKTVK